MTVAARVDKVVAVFGAFERNIIVAFARIDADARTRNLEAVVFGGASY